MLRIQIESQPLQYELAIQPPQLRLETSPPKLQIETEPAIVEIHAPRGELSIDQTPCRYSLGFKNNSDAVRDFAAAGKRAALEAIATINQEWSRIVSIEKGGNPLVELARESGEKPLRTLSLAMIAPPDISYEAKPAEFNPIAAQLQFSAVPASLENDSQWGQVNMQILQYPSLRMWTTGSRGWQA